MDKFNSYFRVSNNIKNYNKIYSQQKDIIFENINDIDYIPVEPYRYKISDRGMRVVFKDKHHIVSENSVINQKTEYTEVVLDNILNEYPELSDSIFPDIYFESQVIADAVVFSLDPNLARFDEIVDMLEKIMTVNGYFKSSRVRRDYSGKIYDDIQYEPNYPEKYHYMLPDVLYHLTTVSNANKIKSDGLLPNINDYFKYSPRVYFGNENNSYMRQHLYRRHKEAILKDNFQYAIITINTNNLPDDVVFYKDTHMQYEKNPNFKSFFTFDNIPFKYITVTFDKLSL